MMAEDSSCNDSSMVQSEDCMEKPFNICINNNNNNNTSICYALISHSM